MGGSHSGDAVLATEDSETLAMRFGHSCLHAGSISTAQEISYFRLNTIKNIPFKIMDLILWAETCHTRPWARKGVNSFTLIHAPSQQTASASSLTDTAPAAGDFREPTALSTQGWAVAAKCTQHGVSGAAFMFYCPLWVWWEGIRKVFLQNTTKMGYLKRNLEIHKIYKHKS